ncbi:hypothetical protein ACOMHN_058001 [Nucella lapillus]
MRGTNEQQLRVGTDTLAVLLGLGPLTTENPNSMSELEARMVRTGVREGPVYQVLGTEDSGHWCCASRHTSPHTPCPCPHLSPLGTGGFVGIDQKSDTAI